MSAIKAMFVAMFVAVGLVVGYLLVSPAYHYTLDALNSTLYDNAAVGSNARDFADDAYWIFYYGLSSLIVLGVISMVVWLYMFMRRRYFSSEVYLG